MIDDVVSWSEAEEPASLSVQCFQAVLVQSPATSDLTTHRLANDSVISRLYLHHHHQ